MVYENNGPVPVTTGKTSSLDYIDSLHAYSRIDAAFLMPQDHYALASHLKCVHMVVCSTLAGAPFERWRRSPRVRPLPPPLR